MMASIQYDVYSKSGFTLVNYKGLNWLKKNNKDGVLDYVMSKTNERTNELGNSRRMVLHSNVYKIVNTSHQQMFTRLFEDEIVKLTKKNVGLYEVIKLPCKVYFDYDLKSLELITTINSKYTNTQYVQKVKKLLLEYFPDATFAISGSFTTEKISLHIVLTNYIITDSNELKLLKFFVKTILRQKDTNFDTAVYGKNQCMKMINQSKLIGRSMENRIQSIIENNDEKQHFINLFDGIVLNFKVQFDLSQFKKIKHLEQNVDILVSIENDKFVKGLNISNLPKFTYSDNIDIDTVLDDKTKTLKLLPIDNGFEFNYKHRIARWCFNNNIDFDTFFTWKCQSGSNNIEKWKHHWDNLHRFPLVLDDVIIIILKKYYPSSFTKAEFKKFKKQFDIGTQNVLTKSINKQTGSVESIKPSHFEQTKISIFNLPMGFGKSYGTMNYLKSKPSVLYITLNIALARNIHSDFKVEHGTQFELYLNFNSKQKKNGILNEQEKLIVCLNSLHYITRSYDVIVVDEIESCFDKLLDTTFMENKQTVWKRLKSLFTNAKQIIVLDAFTTMKTVNVLKKFGEYTVYTAKPENTRTIVYHKLPSKYENGDKVTQKDKQTLQLTLILNKLVSDLNDDKKIWMFYPYINSTRWMNMKAIQEYIESKTNKKVMIYNSNTEEKDKKEIGECNNIWINYDLVISNTSITCGVSFTNHYFNTEYLCIGKNNDSREVIQNSYRPRKLLDDTINVFFLGSQQKPDAFNQDKEVMKCDIYNQLFDDICTEKYSQQSDTFALFAKLAGYKQITYKNQLPKEKEEISVDIITYDSIESLKICEQVEDLTTKIYDHTITFDEKLQLRKWYFDVLFDVCDNSYNLRETIWNNNLNELMIQYFKNRDIFKSILKHNNFDKLPSELKKITLTEEHLDFIFNKIKFKYFKRTGKHSHIQIFTKFINTFLQCSLYSSEQDENKNVKYVLRQFDSILDNPNIILEQIEMYYIYTNDYTLETNNTFIDDDIIDETE